MINFSSPGDISLLLFGGQIKESCQVPILNELGVQETYKTGDKRGQLKTKKGIKVVQFTGLGLKPRKDWETKKHGVYSTDESVLKIIAKKPNTDAGKLALYMLELRGLEKELGTYYAGHRGTRPTGFEHLIYPDSCIRGSINHCSTDTGRTASNRPNVQNISN
jgi:DNA polymerase I-like protein with 3'-5' exonuclease and polymerase domains